MAITGTTTAYSQVAIGDPVNCNLAHPNSAVLSAASSDVIGAGFGVDLASDAIGGYRELIALPSSASGIFHGIVPRRAIPSDEQAVLLGSSVDQLYPGQNLQVFDHGSWRVPITENVTALGAAYLVFSGANAGKFAAGSGAVSQVTTGTVVANNADQVGLDVDSLPRLEVTSTASATDTAVLLRDAWNARSDLAAVAVASAAAAVLTLTFLDDTAHTVVAYSPATADITPIANTATAVAAIARLVPGARWDVTTTGASGAGILNLGDN